MTSEQKHLRYQRIKNQITQLLPKSDDLTARMASVVAVLFHKFDYYFWCGFYFAKDDKLVVGPYQGPLACMELKDKGVCIASKNSKKSIIVPDVNKFEGHVACDSRSKSEIVVPLLNKNNEVVAVLDIDSKSYDSFDEIDAKNLEEILQLLIN